MTTLMQILRNNLDRLRLLVERTSLIGLSPPRALLWHLPLTLLMRAYNRFAAILYALADRLRLFDQSFSRSLNQSVTCGDQVPIYIIVVPDVMHFLRPAVELLSGHAQMAFVLNGASGIEAAYLEKRFPQIPRVHVRTLPKAIWPHGYLLNLLLRTSERDFAICDHDFYLFNPDVLTRLTHRDREFAICATNWHNKRIGVTFPGTHFLVIRVAPVRDIMARYGVGAQLYKSIPGRVADAMAQMGLSAINPPKEYQTFFDSFLLLSALAIHEGLRVRALNCEVGRDHEHVGGTSMGSPVTKDAVYHYISGRFLELLGDETVLRAYRRKISAGMVELDRLRDAIEPATAARVDALVDRVARNTGADRPA